MDCHICNKPLSFWEDAQGYREYYGYWWNDRLVHVACTSVTHLFTEMYDRRTGTRGHTPIYLGHSDICHSVKDRVFWHQMLDDYLNTVEKDGSAKWVLYGMCSIKHE